LYVIGANITPSVRNLCDLYVMAMLQILVHYLPACCIFDLLIVDLLTS